MAERDDAVERLLAPYRGAAGNARYDEYVTEADHALQCADLAAQSGAPDPLIVAALFHDVGHLLPGGAAVETPVSDEGLALPATDDRHELTGARFLRRHFGPEVAAPVAIHVEAKRYLVTTDPDYAATLSPSSVHSLSMQGGPLPAECVCSFEQRPRWEDGVRLRRWDDLAKVPGRRTSTLDDHAERIRRLLR